MRCYRHRNLVRMLVMIVVKYQEMYAENTAPNPYPKIRLNQQMLPSRKQLASFSFSSHIQSYPSQSILLSRTIRSSRHSHCSPPIPPQSTSEYITSFRMELCSGVCCSRRCQHYHRYNKNVPTGGATYQAHVIKDTLCRPCLSTALAKLPGNDTGQLS